MGYSHGEQEIPQELVILGMGKLGGGELTSFFIGYRSDFLLSGKWANARWPARYGNQTFFIRLGQQLINVLHQSTRDVAGVSCRHAFTPVW